MKNKKAYILIGVGIILLIIGCLLLSISLIGGLIVLGSGAIIFIWGFTLWFANKFKAAGYTTKSSTARKRGRIEVGTGLLVLVVGILVNWSLSTTGWFWGGVIIVGLIFLISGLYRLISGRG